VDDEHFNRLKATDPCPDAVVLEPAHSARALRLKETIMTIDVESPATADDVITPDQAPGTGRFGGRRTRRAWLAGAGLAAAAAVAAVIVLPGPGSTGTSLAWSPTPQTVTTADADAARQTCATAIDEAMSEAATGVARANEAIDDATADAPMSELEQIEAPATIELPPLIALDLRGGSGVALFSDGTTMGVCMVLAADGGFEFGGASVFDLPAEQPTELAVSSFMSTALGTDRAASLVIGTAGTADRVQVSVPGLDPITATLSDGQFAAWWPAADSSPITIRSLTADGTVLAEQSLDTATGGAVAEPTDRIPTP
jgi:hypothetical protein